LLDIKGPVEHQRMTKIYWTTCWLDKGRSAAVAGVDRSTGKRYGLRYPKGTFDRHEAKRIIREKLDAQRLT
jgi:hypothetical protein